MIARAPGKVVLSGAYAVLEGAPALVASVDRYVTADTRKKSIRVTPEVNAALRPGQSAPWFDASALRDPVRDEKLGLGSSAAILVASLAALELEANPARSDATLGNEIFARALAAHRAAQRGGSGIDVAASAFGGVLSFRITSPDAIPELAKARLPPDLLIQVFASGESADTRQMLSRIAELRTHDPLGYARIIDRLTRAAERIAAAETGTRYIEGAAEQCEQLGVLGKAASIPIVTAAVSALRSWATSRGKAVLPSGAGGGDIVLVMGVEPLSEADLASAEKLGFRALALSLGARGVHSDQRLDARERENEALR